MNITLTHQEIVSMNMSEVTDPLVVVVNRY